MGYFWVTVGHFRVTIGKILGQIACFSLCIALPLYQQYNVLMRAFSEAGSSHNKWPHQTSKHIDWIIMKSNFILIFVSQVVLTVDCLFDWLVIRCPARVGACRTFFYLPVPVTCGRAPMDRTWAGWGRGTARATSHMVKAVSRILHHSHPYFI